MTTFYLDLENGNDANDGLSFATRWKTLTSGATAVRISPGDTIRVMASPPPVKAGDTYGKWMQSQGYMEMSGGAVKIIEQCDAANGWVSGTGVTVATDSTNRKLGTAALKLTLTASASGRLAYKPINPGSLAGYTQVSFQFRNSIAISSPTMLELRLYTNATATEPYAFSVPIRIPTVSGDKAFPAANYWSAIAAEVGDLGSNVQSIAIYANTVPGSGYLLLDNIVACKSNSDPAGFTHRSLVGRDGSPGCGGDNGEAWYPIAAFEDTGSSVKVYFDGSPYSNAPSRKYGGGDTSGAYVPTWRRECLRLSPASGSSIAPDEMTFNDDGTLGNNILYSFGWNRSDMSSQSDGTYLDGVNGNGAGLYLSNRSFVSVERLSLVRFYFGLWNNGGNPHSYKLDCIIGCQNGIRPSTAGCYIEVMWVVNTSSEAVLVSAINTRMKITGGVMNSGSYGLYVSGGSSVVDCVQVYGSTSNQVAWAGGAVIRNCRFWGGGITSFFYSYYRECYFRNCLFQDVSDAPSGASFANPRIFSEDHNRAAGKTKEYTDGAWMEAVNDANRHTASGWAYRIAITSTTARSALYPADFRLGRIYCKANRQVTVSAWFKRTSAAGIQARLVVPGGQIAGVAADVYADGGAADNVYEQLTVSFTPLADGWVDIEAHAWGSTTTNFVHVDDLSVSGAALNTELEDVEQDGHPFILPVNVEASQGTTVIVIDD